MTHQPTISRRRHPAAFTLPEVLLAMVMLTVGLTSVLMLFPLGARLQADGVNDTAGRAYAETALAALRANANYMFTTSNDLLNPVNPPFNNPTGLTRILSTTASLTYLQAPTGNYQYRTCYWQPKFNGATNHFYAATFAFSSGTGEATVVTNCSVTNANLSGLAQIGFTGSMLGFSQDQTILIQDTTSPNADTYIVRVVNTSGNTITVSPAFPNNTIVGHNIIVVYLPQRALAIATGSIR